MDAARAFSSGVHARLVFFVMAENQRTLNRTWEGTAASLPGDAFHSLHLHRSHMHQWVFFIRVTVVREILVQP